MKTKEELNALKEEVENVNRKLHELTEEELEQVSGGGLPSGGGLLFAGQHVLVPDAHETELGDDRLEISYVR